MQAILIRVGIDQTGVSGNWNAPCNPQTGDFVYVPIRQTKLNVPEMEKRYTDSVVPALERFSKRNNRSVPLPQNLLNEHMHLDPDFGNLTYGDTDRRGRKLPTFKEDDLVVLYAGLRSITENKLVYALIGLLTVKEIVRVKDVPDSRRDENAHTRYSLPTPTDIIVRGKPDESGRLAKYIPMGEYRDKAYRVTEPLLEKWGGLSVKNGYLQRSANPPLFSNPKRFYDWWLKQKPKLIQTNNP